MPRTVLCIFSSRQAFPQRTRNPIVPGHHPLDIRHISATSENRTFLYSSGPFIRPLLSDSHHRDKMSGRHAEYGRPERHNEYFIPGEGISREVIQADICRYLGNDALVKPGAHNVGIPFSFFFFPFFYKNKSNSSGHGNTDLIAGSPGLSNTRVSQSDFGRRS